MASRLPSIYFERLLESSPDIVVAVDREGTIIFYNDGAQQTLGYAPDVRDIVDINAATAAAVAARE